MIRKAARSSLFGALLLFSALGFGGNAIPQAAAQMPNVCPPGQTFVITQGKCMPTQTQQPAVQCPQGQQLNAQTNQCVTVNCPQGQQYNAQTNQCVTAVNCPAGQQYNAQTNQCVTAVNCPAGQRYDVVTRLCVPR